MRAAVASVEARIDAGITAGPGRNSTSVTFTTTGVSTAYDVTATPLSRFALAVEGTNTQVGTTTWTVALEGSLNGTTWTALPGLSHAYPAAVDGSIVWMSDSIARPVTHLRFNVSALTLGTATNIVCTGLGLP